MKNLVRLGAVVLFAGAISLTSCKNEECYECAAFTDASGVEISAEEYCGDEGSLSVSASVAAFELLGGTCTKK